MTPNSPAQSSEVLPEEAIVLNSEDIANITKYANEPQGKLSPGIEIENFIPRWKNKVNDSDVKITIDDFSGNLIITFKHHHRNFVQRNITKRGEKTKVHYFVNMIGIGGIFSAETEEKIQTLKYLRNSKNSKSNKTPETPVKLVNKTATQINGVVSSESN